MNRIYVHITITIIITVIIAIISISLEKFFALSRHIKHEIFMFEQNRSIPKLIHEIFI